MIATLAVFAYFYSVVMGVILIGATLIAAVSLFREWLRERLHPGAREFAILRHPAGGRWQR